MKLTLWKQFSSNHSNGFTLVGVFKDEIQAQKTYVRLRKLLKDIDAWYKENELDKYDAWSASAPEIAIGKEFHFSWEDKTPDSPTDFSSGVVTHFKNIIQIDTSADSWTRRKPYEILLKKSGAKVAGYDSVEEDGDSPLTHFRTKITATLPTEEDATSFLKKWQKKIEAKGGMLVKKGSTITISKLSFDLDLFATLVKALEKMGSTDVQYKLTKAAMDPDSI